MSDPSLGPDRQPLLDLATAILDLDDYQEVLDVLMRQAMEALGAERGFVVLSRDGDLDFRVVRNWSQSELEGEGEPVSRSIVTEVMQSGRSGVVKDALADPQFSQMQSVQDFGIRSVLAAPLRVEGEVIGALYLETSDEERFFDAKGLALFDEMIALSARALERSTRWLVVQERSRMLESDLLARHDFAGIVTQDSGMMATLELVPQFAQSAHPVLVTGESGTGKELVAKALHLNSRRAGRTLMTVNCAAIAANLLESALFGHVRGAFTGATQSQEGILRATDRGSVFLDEVGELPPDLQAKLLRTIQFGEVLPVGASRPVTVDVRFLAATNRDLEADVKAGRFREDLYYRLCGLTLQLPPLRDRPGDVLLLFAHFLEKEASSMQRRTPSWTPKLERILQSYAWPGNVRELENEVRRLIAITADGSPLTVDRLSPRLRESASLPPDRAPSLEEQEKELVELHLRLAGGNRTQAAKGLGISREGLRKKMKRLGLS